ncbi:ABC transporter periplasmic component [Actinorhabdospora filicis]|uniref:ABC transporter periplasmic component n=1 Tax=Actinorhabdospora filicis TaxID=1785913 RepID=A0A9W6SIV0_9ACTN|nr:iron-siderophore ABC transporter substrate-binding protein [Actinorhabdospora filicis]GLZ76329.1 ABC transporter periplasmic component [Actinorhabdospora filicis]
MSRPIRRALTAMLAAAVLTLGLAACGSAKDDKPDAAASGDAGSWPRTVTHDKGQTKIDAKPQKIVALDNSLVEAVVLLDGKLVGGIGSYRNLTGFPEYLGDAVKDTKEVGPLDSPNLELIAQLEPDLIVSATVRHDALYDKLSEIAPTVFVKTTGPQWQDNLGLVAQAMGEEQKAATKLADFKARAKKVGDAINAKAANPTISIVRFLDGPTRLMGKKSFIGIVLSDAGLARPEAQNVDEFSVEISEEQIEKADAKWIFVTTYKGGADSKSKFESNPLWQRLEGVKSGQVKDVRDEIWMTSVSVQGAHMILDDLAAAFGVDAAK